MVNAPGAGGLTAGKSPQIVKMAGGAGNMVTLAKPGQTVAGKQTIVINKPGAQGATTLKGAQGQQIIMVSSAGGLKQLSGGTATMSQAAGNSGVKMIVVSSGQLAQTTSKPITISMPGGQKTVTLAAGGGAKGGQIVQTSSGQILQLPAGGIMAGGKPVTVQMAGGGQKTLTLVQAPKVEPQEQAGGSATADATEAAAAAESIKVEEEKPPQVDGGVATPPNEPIDIEELNKLGMFFSQLDGVDDEDEDGAAKDSTEASAEGPASESDSTPMESTSSDAAAAKNSEDKDMKQETLDLPMEDLSSKDNDNESATEAQKDKTTADEPVKTEPKDPLAQAMDAVTGNSILLYPFNSEFRSNLFGVISESIGDGNANEEMNKSNDDMDGASALAALASAAVTGENGKENNENAANKETSSATNGTSSNAQDQTSKRDANWFDVGIIKGQSHLFI